MKNLNRAWALLFARLILGLIFFLADVMKVISTRRDRTRTKIFPSVRRHFLPVWSLWAVGIGIPFIELIGGVLIILGLRTRDALIALGCVLVVSYLRPSFARRALQLQSDSY